MSGEIVEILNLFAERGGDRRLLRAVIAEWIESRLSNQDIRAWHKGRLTQNTARLVALVGEFQVWGSREGPEPLRVVY